ncbi:hypothetical protein [Deinococcus peraridilitoris]|uniref:hypothetical protein n=1 Tax=Deinococcus peraridilitoris TaxID=432329 RepID=UPI0002F68986|nr:hypothetical protein [Deinococcus peraridilitoris]
MSVVGIDIGKDDFYAHLLLSTGPTAGKAFSLKKIENTPTGCEHLLKWTTLHGCRLSSTW